jgi:hypothetical protein
VKELLELIMTKDEMKDNIVIKNPIDPHIPIRLNFVREKLIDPESTLLYSNDHLNDNKLRFDMLSKFKGNSTNLSQLIPVLVLCKDYYNGDNITYEKNGEQYIKVLRPGGEATGLCPPPPLDGEG